LIENSWGVGSRSARSTGNPGFFREFFIEKFITVNAPGNLSEGPGGGKGEPGVPPIPGGYCCLVP